MKIIFNNSKFVFQKTYEVQDVQFSTFQTEQGILNSQGNVNPLTGWVTTSSYQNIPNNTIGIQVFNTDYSLVDGYATFCVYDSNHNLLARTADQQEILNLESYPSAKYYKMSSSENSINNAYVKFFKG